MEAARKINATTTIDGLSSNGPVVAANVDGTASYSAADVLGAAARVADVPARRLRRRSSTLSNARLRAAVAWLLRTRLGMSMPEIATTLGYTDHTTILGHLRGRCLMPDTQAMVTRIEAELARAGKGRAA